MGPRFGAEGEGECEADPNPNPKPTPNLGDVRVIEDPLYEALDAPSAAQGHLGGRHAGERAEER